MSLISSFEIIKDVVPEQSIFFCIPEAPADAAAVNPNEIKTLLANDLITFFINSNPVIVIVIVIMDQEVCQEILQIELF